MKLENYTSSSRLRSSNINVLISISLVLFLIGLFGILIINAKNYSDYLKEQMIIEVFFKEVYDKKDIQTEKQNHLQVLDSVRKLPYVLKVRYIDKKTASTIAKRELGIDTHPLFEENIFPASIEIILRSEFVKPDNIEMIKSYLLKFNNVEEVKNDNQLMYALYENINNIFFCIIGFVILFTIIAVILINNSIRLKIYSKRFIIKTMQLVGAKRSFILYPFLKEAFLLGLFGSIISLLVLFFIYARLMSYIKQPIDWSQLLPIVGIVFLIGILITIGSALFATWRFFHIKRDKLY